MLTALIEIDDVKVWVEYHIDQINGNNPIDWWRETDIVVVDSFSHRRDVDFDIEEVTEELIKHLIFEGIE